MDELSRTARPIKKTVAIPSIIDAYIRETWSVLVKDTHVDDASYSGALNFMLLAAIEEARKKKGWTRNARETAWSFAWDRETMAKLKLEESLPAYRAQLTQQEFDES